MKMKFPILIESMKCFDFVMNNQPNLFLIAFAGGLAENLFILWVICLLIGVIYLALKKYSTKFFFSSSETLSQ